MKSKSRYAALALCWLAITAFAARPPARPAVAPPATPEPSPLPPPPLVDAAAIDAALRGLVDARQVVGVSALVYERGNEAYFGAFGFADRENNVPMARDTIAQIYSMTKPVTGVALMMLYERGKFGLDDPLAKYLPQFARPRVYAGVDARGQPKYEAPKRAITIRDILRHTAGFPEPWGDSPATVMYRQINPMDQNRTLADACAKLATVPLAYQPGTRWLYSDAVEVQACLVEKISGVPFAQFLELHVFKPLGMASTRHTLLAGDPARPRLAAMYTRNADGTFTRQADAQSWQQVSTDWPLKHGGFGLVSTLDDYLKFARMLLGGGKLGRVRILKPETVRLMATDSLPKEVTDRSWLPGKGQVGFGIDFAVRIGPPKDAREPSGAVGEFFWDGAANTLFWVDPKNDIAAVLFTQYFPPSAIPAHKAFRDAVYRNDPSALAH